MLGQVGLFAICKHVCTETKVNSAMHPIPKFSESGSRKAIVCITSHQSTQTMPCSIGPIDTILLTGRFFSAAWFQTARLNLFHMQTMQLVVLGACHFHDISRVLRRCVVVKMKCNCVQLSTRVQWCRYGKAVYWFFFSPSTKGCFLLRVYRTKMLELCTIKI